MSYLSRLLACIGACLALLVLATMPADAASKTFHDKRGDVRKVYDITSYRVTNGKRVAVTTHHRKLTKKAVDIQMWVDRAGTGKPWDFLVYATLNGKTKAVYKHNWTTKRCSGIRVRRNLRKNQVSLSVPRSCVGAKAHTKIRVRVRVQYNNSGSKGDTAPNKGYSGWVRR